MPFSYHAYRTSPSPADESDIVWCPMLEVLVIGTAAEVPIWGLVDTGAAECILPHDVAGVIKAIPCDEKGTIADFSGRTHEMEYGKVTLQIELEKERIRWPAIVAFSRDRTDAVWGGCGFLNYFRVTFDGPSRKFVIRWRDRSSDRFTVTRLRKSKARTPRRRKR